MGQALGAQIAVVIGHDARAGRRFDLEAGMSEEVDADMIAGYRGEPAE